MDATNCFITTIPLEVLINIFEFLNFTGIQAVSLTCKRFFNACQSSRIQKKILLSLSKNQACELISNSQRFYINVSFKFLRPVVFRNVIFHLGTTVTILTLKRIEFTNQEFFTTISNFPNLRELHIYSCMFFDDHPHFQDEITDPSLSSIISNLSCLSFKELECDSWPLLYRIGQQLKKLKKFEISEYFYQEGYYNRYVFILDIIKRNYETLQHLIIKDIESIDFWKNLIQIKEIEKKLKSFECEFVCWEPDAIFSNFILAQNNLLYLNLGQSKALLNSDLEIIGQNLTQLRRLNLDFCSALTDEGIEKLKNLKQLQSLNILECTEVSGDGLINGLAKQKNLTLKSLNLSGINLNDNHLKKLTENLPKLEVLRLKYPKGDKVTDLSLQCIIQDLINLKELSMEGCVAITDYGLTGYNIETKSFQGHSIKNLKYLRLLDLSMCGNLTDHSIIYGISKIPKLKSFLMPFVPGITVEAMKTLIKNCPLLEQLDFQNDYEMDELLNYAIENLKELTYLNINRMCPMYKNKHKNHYAYVDRCKKEFFVNIDCVCSVCDNTKNIFSYFKKLCY